MPPRAEVGRLVERFEEQGIGQPGGEETPGRLSGGQIGRCWWADSGLCEQLEQAKNFLCYLKPDFIDQIA